MNFPQKTIYLAGPLSGHTLTEANEWRSMFKLMLPPHIHCASPTRCLALSRNHMFSHREEDHPKRTARVHSDGMLVHDLNDVRSSNAVVCNFLDAKKVSIGSVGECFAAYENKVPLIIITANDNPHWHFMLNGIAVVTYSLREAADYVISLLTPRL